MDYIVVKGKRYFSASKKYDEIDWASWDSIIKAFENRIQKWYIEPAESLKSSPHYGFAITTFSCILLDTLSQYYFGAPKSTRENFKKFVRKKLNGFSQKLGTSIQHYSAGNTDTMEDRADVLYHAFRCGILHEAHITPYGALSELKQTIEEPPKGLTKYANSSDCPTIIIDPWKLFDQVKGLFENYIEELSNSNPRFNELREKFKVKFSTSFGVDVSGAT